MEVSQNSGYAASIHYRTWCLLIILQLGVELKETIQGVLQASFRYTAPEESKMTLEEMLLSTPSSISCSSALANHLRREEANSSDMHAILESSKSVAYIVGSVRRHISQLDKDLQSIIRDMDFFEMDYIVKFCSEGKLIVPMDYMEGGVEEVKEIREILNKAMDRHLSHFVSH